MKLLGLIGGISWVSTIDYYKHINRYVNEKNGGLNFAECLIHSFSYADVRKFNDKNDWDGLLALFAKACENFKRSGAQGIVLCANTAHIVAERLEVQVGLPVIHIASATAEAIKVARLKKVALLGTRFTMEYDFFTDKLKAQHIEVIIPDENDREFIHKSIFDELGKGILLPETKARYLAVMEKLALQGAEGIILGCTEIPLLIQQEDFRLPVFDTTLIHARAAVDFALA